MYVDKEHGESQEAKVGVTGGEGAGADEGSGLVRTVPTTLGFGFRLGVGAGDRLRASAGPVRARKVGGARGEAPLGPYKDFRRFSESNVCRLV